MNTLDQIMENQDNPENGSGIEFDKEQWKEQKQHEMEETFQLLNDHTQQVSLDPHKLLDYLELQARIPAMSVGNTILILAQRDGSVTKMATFKDWQAQGRSVKKGENGCRVLMPVNYKRDDGTEGTSFRVSRVFDIGQTQTHSPQVKDRAVVAPELSHLVTAIVRESPVPIVKDDSISNEQIGVYDPASRKIRMRGDISDEVSFPVLARELSHVALASNQINTYDRDQMSSRATCSAWMICKRYGLATPILPLEKLRDDISSGEPVQIRAALHEIRQATNLTCSRIDRGLDPVKETVSLKKTSEPVR